MYKTKQQKLFPYQSVQRFIKERRKRLIYKVYVHTHTEKMGIFNNYIVTKQD